MNKYNVKSWLSVWLLLSLGFPWGVWFSCSDTLNHSPPVKTEHASEPETTEITAQEKTFTPEETPSSAPEEMSEISDAQTPPEIDRERPESPEPPEEAREPDQPQPPKFQPGVFTHAVVGRTLRLYVLGPTLVRIHYTRDQQGHPDRGWTHVLTDWPKNPYPSSEQAEHFLLHTPSLTFQIHKTDASIQIKTTNGQILSQDIPSTTTTYPSLVRKRIDATEYFYGFGEKTGPLNKRGFKLSMWNTDPLYPTNQYTPTADPIYQSIPFFIGLRNKQAYGVYLNNTFRSIFDVGQTAPDELRIETTGGDLDYFFFYGPAVREVVQQYTQITGRYPLPPLWTLGYHQSRWSYAPATELQRIATELRSRQLPCDGLWLDIDYMDGFRSFTWNPTGFPQPATLLSQLQNDGFKVTAILDPGIKQDPGGTYQVYNTGMTDNHFVRMPDQNHYVGVVWPGNSLFPDFTNPSTRQWWSQFVKDFVSTGLQGLWIDMNEPATWQPSGFPLDSVFAGEGIRTDHRETHNVYALLMAKATHEGMKLARPQQRPFVLTRAGFAGIQRYAAVWTGDMASDWDHLRMAPAMLMNLGLSGVPMIGSDIGGFTGGPSAELFARWIQLGSISPFFRTHVQSSAPRQEPWSFGTSIESISRNAIALRYQWLPYFYSLMYEASETGIPLLRPLFLAYQNDEKTYQRNDQIMLGDFVLVAPVLDAGQKSRMLYLPPGIWFDHATTHAFEGAQEMSVAAPLERLPLLIAQGAILPSWPPTQYVGQQIHRTLYIDLYPVPNIPPSRFVLYLDDGQTTAYQTGQYYKRTLQLTTTSRDALFVMEAPQGSHTITETHTHLRWHGIKRPPTACVLDGQSLSSHPTLTDLDTKEGWFYDTTTETIHTRVPISPQTEQIRCNYDATQPLHHKVQVQWTVQLPANTPTGDVYFASNLLGWHPNGRMMQRSGNTATLTLTLQKGMALEYKYTLGQWTQVEKQKDCKERDNRLLHITTTPQQNVSDTIEQWAQIGCP